MLKTTLKHFHELRPSVKAMVYLHWIYAFVGTLTGTFIQIYLYQRFTSVTFNIVAQIVYFIACALGFSLVGAIASWYRINMKWGYVLAFLTLCASFLLLIGNVDTARALVFMFANGFGLGLYWLTLHTFELTETDDHERDYYSSVLSAGNQMIGLIAPGIATLLLYLSDDVLHYAPFTLLFALAPLIYLCGIPLFRRIRTYRPAPVDMLDFTHFLKDPSNRRVQTYLFAGSANYALSSVVLPLAAIIFLGSEKHVGLFNTAFAVISVFALMLLSKKRHSGNRLNFLFATAMSSAVITLLVALHFTLPVFIAFTLGSVILAPLLRVSGHVIDLETMETLGRPGRDFFPTMVFRDAAFGVWRVLILGAFALFIGFVGEGERAVRSGFVLVALSFALLYYGALRYYRGRPIR